ncbi:hypothetical protein [Aldersonia kunmingensis]|uniref:hypothetical protein n=1 Tax=Aldersonia kunmingensis TaxID=408066 RepID=UPI000836BC73|nr:hypothetical protein [Aldersonia kunmingensis]
MKLTRIAAIVSMVVASAVVGVGTTYAAPPPPPGQQIHYNVKLVDKTVVATLDGGIFKITTDRQSFEIADPAGNPVLRMPLSFGIDSVAHPLNGAIEGNGTVLKLTPDMDPAKARPFVRPVASPVEDQRALNMFTSYFAVGTAVGSFIGTAVGVVAGAIIGCLLGAPFFGLGCIPAATVGASLGGILGTIVVGGPVLVASAVDLITTLTAPPGTTKYNYQTPAPVAPVPPPPPKP